MLSKIPLKKPTHSYIYGLFKSSICINEVHETAIKYVINNATMHLGKIEDNNK